MKPNLIRLHLAIAVGTAMITLTGCVSSTPNIDSKLGASINALKAQQIIDPNASNNTNTATLDAAAALEVIGRYKESYKKASSSTNAYAIGIGK